MTVDTIKLEPLTHIKMKDQVKIDDAINQLGQALYNAEWHYNRVIEEDRIQQAMRTLMSISDNYKKYLK